MSPLIRIGLVLLALAMLVDGSARIEPVTEPALMMVPWLAKAVWLSARTMAVLGTLEMLAGMIWLWYEASRWITGTSARGTPLVH